MATQAIKATTQEHLDIYTIKDHLIILKDGSTALVLQVSAINFGLLSEDEQDALIFSYASLLNSLSFPIQILMRSIKKDISAYLELLDSKLEETNSQKLKEQIIKYRSFVRSLVKKNKVLEKKFYIIIPYGYLGVGQVTTSLNPFAKAPQKPPQDLEYLLPKARTELYPRRDHLIRQLARLGLQSRQLTTQELVTMFYRAYNPSAEGVEQYLTLPSDYETPSVQTEQENTSPPTPAPTPVPPTQATQPAPVPQTPPPVVSPHPAQKPPTPTPVVAPTIPPAPGPNPLLPTTPITPSPQPPTPVSFTPPAMPTASVPNNFPTATPPISTTL